MLNIINVKYLKMFKNKQIKNNYANFLKFLFFMRLNKYFFFFFAVIFLQKKNFI
jgi:hypothetical protein